MKRITQQRLDRALHLVRQETFQQAYELGLAHGKAQSEQAQWQERDKQNLVSGLEESTRRFVEGLRK